MTYQPGDLVFCHSKGFISRAIRIAEWFRFRGGDHYNHVAVLYDQISGTLDTADNWLVIQAEGRGVTCTRTLDEVAPGGSYEVVPVIGLANTQNTVAFAFNEVGSKYGFLTIVSILFTLFTPKFVNIMLPNTWICSALAAESLRAGGWIHHWDDLYQVNPAELYEVVR